MNSRAVHNFLLATGIAAFMTLTITLYLYYVSSQPKITLKSYAVSLIFLTMMASMLNAFSYFLATSNSFLNTIIAVNFSMLTMTITIVYLLWHVSIPGEKQYSTGSGILIALLLVWNEASMGILIFQLTGAPSNMISGQYLFPILLSYGIMSPFFVVPMFIEMAAAVILFHTSGLSRISLLSIAFTTLFTPEMFPAYSVYLLAAQTVVMISFMILILENVARKKYAIRPTERSISFSALVLSSAMMMSDFLGYLASSITWIAWFPYAVTMLAGMAVYFSFSLSKDPGSGRTGWIKSPWYVVSLLLLSFIAEWFTAATFIFIESGIAGTGFPALGSFSTYLGGVNQFTTVSVPIDVIYVIGSVTDNALFLMLMGVEMGALVIFRMKSIQWKEKRVNLFLALLAFFVYTTYLPTLGPAWISRYVPLWANVGAQGPLYPAVIGTVIGSYALYAVLALLFGRRSYCGTLCPSAVMYGGTLGQEMISFNYESQFSKKNLGSKYKGPVLTVIYNSWIILFLVSFISIYSTGTGQYTLFGIDASVFFSVFVWNVLWYLFFFSIPFLGMSPCRRYGWCSTGTFVGFFSRIGIFRLKVREPATCVSCKTKDCVKACEVGLADLPGQFIEKGYFKSSKCVGSGSCLLACPYDNIYFYDIRNFIRDRRSRQ
jgi:polyferredoxin